MPATTSFFFWPAKMEVNYLPAVHVTATDTYEKLRDDLHKVMSDFIISHQNPS